jgi:hypothetical protein
LDSEGKRAEWTTWERVCGVQRTQKRRGGAVITKNEVISINQLNYNAHEKYHVTEEFVGKTTRH